MASHISPMTWSRPSATFTPRVIFSRSWPSVLTAAMRRLVPPRSTPMEKSGMRKEITRLQQRRSDCWLSIEQPRGATIFNHQSGVSNRRILLLALGAVVAAAAGDHDSFDRRFADEAGLAFAAVDAVPELEESFFAIGVHVVGNGGAAERDRFFQDFFYGDEELAELVARDG